MLRLDVPQYADLFCALQNRDIGNDSNHNGGYHERNCHKRNQNIRNHVDDGGDGGHQQTDIVCVSDSLSSSEAVVLYALIQSEMASLSSKLSA